MPFSLMYIIMHVWMNTLLCDHWLRILHIRSMTVLDMWYTGALQFVIRSDDYSSGQHTMIVTATSTLDETEEYTFSFGMSDTL